VFLQERKYGFLGEDKQLANKLYHSFGRAGVLAYVFDADYGSQTTGGCFFFREGAQKYWSFL
jgi:hypothetical protein